MQIVYVHKYTNTHTHTPYKLPLSSSEFSLLSYGLAETARCRVPAPLTLRI